MNREHFLQYQREYNWQHKAERQAGNRRWQLRNYGLTVAQFRAILNAQENKCAICGLPLQKTIIDHNHATGKVRGILCQTCNSGLGCFKDETTIIRKAIDYLNFHNTRQKQGER